MPETGTRPWRGANNRRHRRSMSRSLGAAPSGSSSECHTVACRRTVSASTRTTPAGSGATASATSDASATATSRAAATRSAGDRVSTIAAALSKPNLPACNAAATLSKRGGTGAPDNPTDARVAAPSRIRRFTVGPEAPVVRCTSSTALRQPRRAARPSRPSSRRERSATSPANATRSASTRRPTASTSVSNRTTAASSIPATADGRSASTHAAVVRLLTEVEAVGRRVDALRVALAGEVAERSRRELGREGLAARLGCRNAVELVQRTTGASGPTVNRRIRLGAATRASVGLSGAPVPPRFESVAAALHAGRLGFDSAAAIVDTLSPALRVAAARDVAVAEASLVAEAVAPDPAGVVPVDADTVRLQATVWHSVLDPDGAAPSERDIERRCLRLLAPRHGLVPVSGMLMPEVAGALQRYADACTNPRTADLPAPDRPASTDGASTDGAARAACPETADPCAADGTDQRSRAQQLHDVLGAIVQVAARAADAPSVAGNAPTLLVSVRAEDLASGRGAAFADGIPTPISIAAARHIGC